MKKNSFRGTIGMAAVAAMVFGLLVAGCGSSPKAAAPDLTGVSSYYVRADGDDKNAGTSEAAPFKTLQRAVDAAAKTSVKKITVIGTIAGNTKIQDADPSVQEIKLIILDGITTLVADPSGDERDPDSITITGKPGASGQERAVLTSPGGDYTVSINKSTVIFENIEISGNPSDPAFFVEDSHLTLSTGTKIINNSSTEAGGMKYGDGGGIIAVRSILVMCDNAEVSGNKATEQGGGLFLQDSILAMRNQSKITGNNAGKPGGGVFLQDSALIMYDTAQITGNESSNLGGGIVAIGYEIYSSIAMNGDSKILSNKAAVGGGVRLSDHAHITLNDSAVVSDNTATEIGGGVYGQGANAAVNKGANAVIENNQAPEAPDSNFTFE
ncbi:MAG: hypothetical protein LBK61_13530 [Spirochaetaceae bacterium]|jgi:predicted outer membrane repeat protein|nr:hypothetical protein [Spirochaetaceae bacterium]